MGDLYGRCGGRFVTAICMAAVVRDLYGGFVWKILMGRFLWEKCIGDRVALQVAHQVAQVRLYMSLIQINYH